jgi:AraC-like DNA-binding protein
VIGNTSVVATRASLSRSSVYNLISAVFQLCVTRVTNILKAKKAKGIH